MGRARHWRADAHSHPVEEVLTVSEGEADMWIGEPMSACTAGQSLMVPAGLHHGFRNSGHDTLHIHAVLASAVLRGDPGGPDGSGAALGVAANEPVATSDNYL